MNSDNKQAKGMKGPPAPDQRDRSTSPYRYYLEDHPVLGPLLTLLLGAACLYATIFSTLLRDMLVGANASRGLIDNFYLATGWIVAFVIGIMFLSFIFLLIHGVEAGVRRARRRPAVCANCGAAEVPRRVRFVHEPIDGTDWETVICSNCGHSWYGRR